jgi:hypothetical protein
MLAPVFIDPIALKAQSVHRIENAKGTKVSCVRGVTWITQERDPRDLILTTGQSVILDRPGLAIVYAFKDAVITVSGADQYPEPGTAEAGKRPELQGA